MNSSSTVVMVKSCVDVNGEVSGCAHVSAPRVGLSSERWLGWQSLRAPHRTSLLAPIPTPIQESRAQGDFNEHPSPDATRVYIMTSCAGEAV